MLPKNLLLTPLIAAGLASASITPKSITFELLALAPGTEVHFSGFQAATSSLVLNLEDQNATCKTTSDNLATFSLVGGNLFLYQSPRLLQQLYVDRSAAGQGQLGYTTSPNPSPARSERTGWRIELNGNVTFRGAGFIACPSAAEDGPWTLWVDVGTSQPGGGAGCLPLAARAIITSKPNSCQYSE
ncbi:hypothetical protein AK830_g7530 [Neonectria ditissima]|uniref:Cell wall protein PhiA n=1 Tax=Neonectria ditissima TaxID=78410 RepID=A0A0P7B9Z9_9HYPO|nr:hypothetical protein AK830_g7530 [Neonectria ditissima]